MFCTFISGLGFLHAITTEQIQYHIQEVRAPKQRLSPNQKPSQWNVCVGNVRVKIKLLMGRDQAWDLWTRTVDFSQSRYIARLQQGLGTQVKNFERGQMLI